MPADPAAWLATQLDGPDPALAVAGASAADGLIAFREDRKERAERKLEGTPPPGMSAEEQPHRVRDMVRADGRALADYVLATETPFRERLVWFWTNHFTVSLRRGECHLRHHALSARGDPAARHRPLRGHAVRGDAPSGDADVSRQRGLDRAGQPGRPEIPSRSERKSRARVARAAHRHPGVGLHPAGRDRVREDPDGVELRTELQPAAVPVPPEHPRAGPEDPDGANVPVRRGRWHRRADVARQPSLDVPQSRDEAGASLRRRRSTAWRPSPGSSGCCATAAATCGPPRSNSLGCRRPGSR